MALLGGQSATLYRQKLISTLGLNPEPDSSKVTDLHAGRSSFALGRLRHRAINQEGRKLLGAFIEFGVRLLQTALVVTLERCLDFLNQRFDLPPLIRFNLLADKR
jgi:hypothetical protein